MYSSLLKALGVVITSSALLTACGGGGGGGSTPVASGGSSISSGSTSVSSGSGVVADNSATPPRTTPANDDNSGGNTESEPTIALPTTVISSVFDGKNDANQPLTLLLQDDSSYFLVYSNAATQNFLGVVLGTGTLSNGSFSSANSLDLSLIGTGAQSPDATTLSASYAQKQAVNGMVSYTTASRTSTFTSNYNGSYETLPSLASLAGVYTGSLATKDVREDNIELTISADGTVSGKLTCGCSVGAKLVPRTNGIAYDATLSFTQGTHPLTGKSFAGNVYLDVKSNRLYIAGKLSNSADLAIFVGKKS